MCFSGRKLRIPYCRCNFRLSLHFVMNKYIAAPSLLMKLILMEKVNYDEKVKKERGGMCAIS